MNAPEWATRHLRPGERPRWWGRPSLAGVIPIATGALVAATGILAAAAYGYEQPALFLTGAVALGATVLGLLVQAALSVARLLRTYYVVTDERLYVLHEHLSRGVQVVPLARVSRVGVARSPAALLLGYWNLEVGVYSAGDARLRMPAVADGARMLEELRDGMARAARPAWLLRND